MYKKPAPTEKLSPNTPIAMSLLKDFVTALRNAVQVPYCTGSVTLDPAASTLFYKASDSERAELLNFAHPTEEKLEALSKACQAATFGRAQQDFAPLELGILHTIRQDLLRGQKAEKPIRVELYKLNVYGPGAFFKSHVDTPRSNMMFGSLVIVLPTVHTGGSLVFHHGGHEFTFDSAQAVAVNTEGPRAAFAAFYSDVEHEVLPVESGYRVTLTYNLYFKNSGSNNRAADIPNELDQHLKASFEALLKDPTFLPDGCLVGFSLSHRYPFEVRGNRDLTKFFYLLKGADAAILHMCADLDLHPAIKAVYSDYEETEFCLMDSFCDFADEEVEDTLICYLEEQGGQVVYPVEKGPLQSEYGPKKAVPIKWFKFGDTPNTFETPYVAHGNEPSVDYAYGELCLVVDIPPAASRGLYPVALHVISPTSDLA
ncbi:unnamed protein product [Cyclocybe aegerita]|uniref:Fe2OG dioxygenase domain-containing protein n=1 Tax=Cyclocybe aegerita TaxID=1973307 RepID=A0A8S0WDN9_CYCAE|nr:unnamed protein product [Cyclocybe aegerita]